MFVFILINLLTCFVIIPTIYGDKIPGIVPNVFVMPNTTPAKAPDISFILTNGPLLQKNPLFKLNFCFISV